MNAKKLSTVISDLIQMQFDTSVEVVISRPDEQFGDFATNVALQLAGKLQKNPREIAGVLAAELRKTPSPDEGGNSVRLWVWRVLLHILI